MELLGLLLGMLSLDRTGAEHMLGIRHQLLLPVLDLIRVHLELLGEIGQGTLSSYCGQRDLGSERFIRTLKENLLWVRSFETIEELRLALLEFKRTYNEQWMLEKYDYRSPAQVRRDLLGLDAAA